MERNKWIKSSRSGAAGHCVQVFTPGNADGVLVRNSKRVAEPSIAFTAAEWEAFVAGVKAGEFDLGD